MNIRGREVNNIYAVVRQIRLSRIISAGAKVPTEAAAAKKCHSRINFKKKKKILALSPSGADVMVNL